MLIDVTTRDGDRTPLHKASSWGDAQIARLFVGCNMDASAKYNDGQTPIYQTLGPFHNGMNVASLLLEHGADGTVNNEWGSHHVGRRDGETWIVYACSSNVAQTR